MSLYYQCPECGANLDPGEKCDCEEEQVKESILRQLEYLIARNDDIYAAKLLLRAINLEKARCERGMLK